MALVGKDLKDHLVPTPCCGQLTPHHVRLPRALSNLALNTTRDEASMAFLGGLSQCLTLSLVIYDTALLTRTMDGGKERKPKSSEAIPALVQAITGGG